MWLAALFFVTAIFYASVGFGGGSTYNALLVLSGADFRIVPIVALVCNLIVVVGGAFRFHRAKHLDFSFALPFIVLSVPMAWLGGRTPIDQSTFMLVLGLCLVAAGLVMLVGKMSSAAGEKPLASRRWVFGLPLGATIGFLAGLVGIGGGIFLAPLLHLARLADPKRIAATASLFIAMNSAAGLVGQTSKVGVDYALAGLMDHALLFAAVLVGGQLGSKLASSLLAPATIRRVTGLLVVYVGLRLVLGWSDLQREEPAQQSVVSAIHRGMSVAHNYQKLGVRGYGSETSAATLKELKALGINWVSLTPFGFMSSIESQTIEHVGDMPAGETDVRIRAEIQRAHALGLNVMLKPHVWVSGGAWRGELRFGEKSEWDDWFESYTKWICHYAEIAEELNVGVLVVGVEFKSSATKMPWRWRRVVAEVRKLYGGNLVYSANWDAAEKIEWWDALDYIGVQFYPPVAKTPNDSAEEIRHQIRGHMKSLGDLSAAFDLPVLITEVGYASRDGATLSPHTWPERADEVQVDEEEQATAYREFLAIAAESSWLHGVYWWKWFTDPNTKEEGRDGFSPRGKLAEKVLKDAYTLPPPQRPSL